MAKPWSSLVHKKDIRCFFDLPRCKGKKRESPPFWITSRVVKRPTHYCEVCSRANYLRAKSDSAIVKARA